MPRPYGTPKRPGSDPDRDLSRLPVAVLPEGDVEGGLVSAFIESNGRPALTGELPGGQPG